MLSHFSPVRFFVTQWTIARQALLSMGLSKQEYWSGFPFPPPGDLPDPGIEPGSHVSPGSLPLAPPGKPLLTPTLQISKGSQENEPCSTTC